jgi:hypothetical protein
MTGAFLNTVVVRGDQLDTIPENNVASALLRVNESFHPPLEVRCGNLSLDQKRTVAGTEVSVRAAVENVFGKPLPRTLVNARGDGMKVTTRTNGQGVAVVRLDPTGDGVVQFTVAARTLDAAGADHCTAVLAVRHASRGVTPTRSAKPTPGGKPSPAPGTSATTKPRFTG